MTSLEEIENTIMAYAISMWVKRQQFGISDPVKVETNHVRNRLASRVWTKRVVQAMANLCQSHPYITWSQPGFSVEYNPLVNEGLSRNTSTTLSNMEENDMSKLSNETKTDIFDYHNLATLQSPVMGDAALERLLEMVAEVKGKDWLND